MGRFSTATHLPAVHHSAHRRQWFVLHLALRDRRLQPAARLQLSAASRQGRASRTSRGSPPRCVGCSAYRWPGLGLKEDQRTPPEFRARDFLARVARFSPLSPDRPTAAYSPLLEIG